MLYHVLELNLLIKYFPKSIFIHIFRDGRDAYCSAHKNRIPHGKNIKEYAKYWKKCINSRLKRGNNPLIFDVKYEKLVSEPERVIRKLMKFLDIPYLKKQINPLNYSKTKESEREIHKNLVKKINTSSVNRWKKELTKKEVIIFQKIAGKELVKLNYSLEKY